MRKKIELPEKYIKLMGYYTDGKIAALAGCSRSVVCRIRQSLGIPPREERREVSEDIYSAIVRTCGIMSDNQAAARAGVSHSTVAKIRKRLDVATPARSGRRRREETAAAP